MARPWNTTPELWERLKPLAREHRHQSTTAEDLLWQRIRRKQLGIRFRRQHPIERFIVDFYCPERRLVVEVDGPIHEQFRDEDAARQELLESRRLQVLRFTNAEVESDIESVLNRIAEYL